MNTTINLEIIAAILRVCALSQEINIHDKCCELMACAWNFNL